MDSKSYCTDEMLYAAFRSAFVQTLDCMLRCSLDQQHLSRSGACGFLDIYPVLSGTAPQVQLEYLLRTWNQLLRCEGSLAPVDAFVVNAAFETLGKTANRDQRTPLSSVWRGPMDLRTAADHWVTSKVRAIQIAMDESDSIETARVEQSLDSGPRQGANARKSIFDELPEGLLEIVGRWAATKEIVLGSVGLLTEDEQDILRIFFEEQPGLLR